MNAQIKFARTVNLDLQFEEFVLLLRVCWSTSFIASTFQYLISHINLIESTRGERFAQIMNHNKTVMLQVCQSVQINSLEV